MLTDILSIPEARVAIAAPDERHDDVLALMNSAVSERFDAMLGPVVRRTVTEVIDPVGYKILLGTRPVVSITSVTEYRAGVSQVLTAETLTTAGSYLFKAPDGLIIRRQGFADFPFQGRLEIVYTAGRAETTATVSPRFKQAAAITLAHIWRNEYGSGNQTFGAADVPMFGTSFSIPNRAIELIAGDRLTPGIA